jgi:hypothetical protein
MAVNLSFSGNDEDFISAASARINKERRNNKDKLASAAAATAVMILTEPPYPTTKLKSRISTQLQSQQSRRDVISKVPSSNLISPTYPHVHTNGVKSQANSPYRRPSNGTVHCIPEHEEVYHASEPGFTVDFNPAFRDVSAGEICVLVKSPSSEFSTTTDSSSQSPVPFVQRPVSADCHLYYDTTTAKHRQKTPPSLRRNTTLSVTVPIQKTSSDTSLNNLKDRRRSDSAYAYSTTDLYKSKHTSSRPVHNRQSSTDALLSPSTPDSPPVKDGGVFQYNNASRTRIPSVNIADFLTGSDKPLKEKQNNIGGNIRRSKSLAQTDKKKHIAKNHSSPDNVATLGQLALYSAGPVVKKNNLLPVPANNKRKNHKRHKSLQHASKNWRPVDDMMTNNQYEGHYHDESSGEEASNRRNEYDHLSRVPKMKSFDAVVFDVLKVSPEDFAKQLTLLDLPIFRLIKPDEITCCGWTKMKKKEKLSPNVVAMTRRFNHTSFWVIREVLHASTIKIRAEVLTHFIRIAKKLFELNNLHSLMAVIQSLNSSSIFRLKQTWALVKQHHLRTFNQLLSLVKEDGNRESLRSHMETIRLPCIPYLGMYLSDVIFINSAHPDTGGLESHERTNKMNNILRVISEFQLSNYGTATHSHN